MKNKEEVVAAGLNKFYEALQLCANEQEISTICSTMLALCSKSLAGIEGNEFKDGFLECAIKDKGTIKFEAQTVQ